MKSKIIGLLLLVVVLPIALLSWVGYQLAQQIATQQQEQIQNLLKDQLAEVDFRLKKYFKAPPPKHPKHDQPLRKATDTQHQFKIRRPRFGQQPESSSKTAVADSIQ
ncbi:hypothetical protein OAG56_05590 [Mariniblastus sp.]|nr:hypothetical protein [Mariniblastus sp.]MDB4756827.1 hypothetical protein [Mariniblastus sp.]